MLLNKYYILYKVFLIKNNQKILDKMEYCKTDIPWGAVGVVQKRIGVSHNIASGVCS